MSDAARSPAAVATAASALLQSAAVCGEVPSPAGAVATYAVVVNYALVSPDALSAFFTTISRPSADYPHTYTVFCASGGGSIMGGVEASAGCGARCWFPCLDTLSDRCTYDIEVTLADITPAVASRLGIDLSLDDPCGARGAVAAAVAVAVPAAPALLRLLLRLEV